MIAIPDASDAPSIDECEKITFASSKIVRPAPSAGLRVAAVISRGTFSPDTRFGPLTSIDEHVVVSTALLTVPAESSILNPKSPEDTEA